MLKYLCNNHQNLFNYYVDNIIRENCGMERKIQINSCIVKPCICSFYLPTVLRFEKAENWICCNELCERWMEANLALYLTSETRRQREKGKFCVRRWYNWHDNVGNGGGLVEGYEISPSSVGIRQTSELWWIINKRTKINRLSSVGRLVHIFVNPRRQIAFCFQKGVLVEEGVY